LSNMVTIINDDIANLKFLNFKRDWYPFLSCN
jgi:hypothetical protein